MILISNTKLIIKIDWSSKTTEALKLYDCDFDSAMSGLDIYCILLTDKKMILDESDLLFWNSKNKNTLNQITSNDNSVTCKQGILFSDEFLKDFEADFDGIFEVDLTLVNNNVEFISFFVGRPPSREYSNNNWINDNLVKKVKDEFVDVDVLIEPENYKESTKYYYNKNGALSILSFEKFEGKWYVIQTKNNEEFKDGLSEIINKYCRCL